MLLLLCIFINYFKSHDKTGSIYFQNHPGTKHLHGDSCPPFAGIPPVSRGILPCWDGMKNIPASYKYNVAFIKKWLYAFHAVYRPVLFFIPFCFSCKQLLRGCLYEKRGRIKNGMRLFSSRLEIGMSIRERLLDKKRNGRVFFPPSEAVYMRRRRDDFYSAYTEKISGTVLKKQRK